MNISKKSFAFGLFIGLMSLASMAAYGPGIIPGTATAPSADTITSVWPTSNLVKYAAPTGGLVNTTAVSALAAAGASNFNYVTNVTCVNSHASISTEVEVQDGNGGTVMFRGYAAAGGGGFAVTMARAPLKGTANTAVYIKEVTATATTGVVCSLQGFTGT